MGSVAKSVSKVVPLTLASYTTKSLLNPLARSSTSSISAVGSSVASHPRRHFFTQASTLNVATEDSTLYLSRNAFLEQQPSLKTNFSSFLSASHLKLSPYPREIVFLGGAPGAGKGTNSLYVAKLRGFDAPTIVVSDLLNTSACKKLKDSGAMVDDAFVFNALLKELEKSIYRNGVVVDGFPRTAKQAEYIVDLHQSISSPLSPAPQMMFVMLHIDEAASIKRQQARGKEIVALNEKRTSMSLPLLEVRATDVQASASKARYAVFQEQLDAVMGLSRRFPMVVVDASSTLDAVRTNLAETMATLPPISH